MPATAALAAAPLPLGPGHVAHPTAGLAARSGPGGIADHEAPLIWRAQAGNADAWGELYSRYKPNVRRYLTSRLPGRAADVEDLVAETFLTAMQRIHTFGLQRPGQFGNWLIGIAKYKLLTWLEQTVKRDEALVQRLSAAAEIAESVSPEEIVLDRLEAADALSRLGPRARRALVLHHVEDLSSAEVALALGTTKRSLWALTGRARSECRGQVRRCACGCGRTLRPERWGRDRYASAICRRRAATAATPPRASRFLVSTGRHQNFSEAAATVASPLCACGCGAALPAVRAYNRLYATETCRNRAAWRRRQEAQRRYLAGPVTADPAVERVLEIVRAADSAGITRAELARRTRLLAGRLDRAIDLLAGRWSISVVLEPSDGRLVVRHRALAGVAARRAA